jgi:hypothetical protein
LRIYFYKVIHPADYVEIKHKGLASSDAIFLEGQLKEAYQIIGAKLFNKHVGMKSLK